MSVVLLKYVKHEKLEPDQKVTKELIRLCQLERRHYHIGRKISGIGFENLN